MIRNLAALTGWFVTIAGIGALCLIAAACSNRAAVSHPASCKVSGVTVASGTRLEVDAQGNAWTVGSNIPRPYTVVTCRDGVWSH